MDKTITHRLLIVAISILFLCSCSQRSKLLNDTYRNIDFCEVKQILEKSCLKCHSQQGLAPFPFTNSERFKRKKSILLYVLRNEIMPPWKPDPSYQKFKHQYNLDKDELEKLYTWIYYGANDKGSCEFPVLKEGVLKYEMTGECIQFSNKCKVLENDDHYRCFTVINPFKEDVYLSSIDLIPGNNRIVHHMSAFFGTVDQPGYNINTDCGEVFNKNSKLVSNWTMGTIPLKLKQGQGFFFPKNAYLFVQVHFSAGSMNLIDSSYICLNKANYAITQEVFYNDKNKFDISFEPNTIKRDTVVIDVDKDIQMLTIWPHTHRLAQEVECYAELPDKTRMKLIRIPRWDYFWHSSYEFIEPKYIPKGSKLYMAVKFDNTSDNKMNPYSPPRKITWGSSSKDEMLTLAYTYTVAKK